MRNTVHESKVLEIFESPFKESWIPMNTDQTSINTAQMSPSYEWDSPQPTSPSYEWDSPQPTSPSYECDSPQPTSPSYMPNPTYVKKSPITFKDNIDVLFLTKIIFF